MFEEIEKKIGIELPSEFKEFVLNLKGEELLEPARSFCVKEPSPFGKGLIDLIKIIDLDELDDDEFFEDGFLAIGGNLFGDGLYLSIREDDFGSVYYWDHEFRCMWDDETFYSRFENLADSIKLYLKERKDVGEIKWQSGFESVYFIAGSFDEFLRVSNEVEVD